MIKFCKKCAMASTRLGLTFDKNGICSACKKTEEYNKTDWNKRWKELEILCDKHRDPKKEYNCLIGVSGGKDSHFIVGLFKENLNMNPIGFMVDNGSWTKTGRDNFYNLSERFDIDILNFTSKRKTMREKTLQGFIEECWPSKYWDKILYEEPLKIAQKLGINLVVWGENTAIQRGSEWADIPDAKEMMLDQNHREFYKEIDFIFTSYYVPWNRWVNVNYAIKNGFKTLEQEWVRWGLEDFPYQQIDTIGYLCNNYCKFIKFGFGTVTELCCDAVRSGKMTRKEALKMIKENDWKVDPYMVSDFCQGLKITKKEFWEVIDQFANKDLLYKAEDGYWKLKEEFLK